MLLTAEHDLDIRIKYEGPDANSFPDTFFMCKQVDGPAYGAYTYKRDNLAGLACFPDEHDASLYASRYLRKHPVCAPVQVNLEEAIKIGKERQLVAPELKVLFMIDVVRFLPVQTEWL